MPFCKNCGKEISADIAYCPHCGASQLPPAAAPPPPPPPPVPPTVPAPPKKKISTKLLIGIAAIVAVLVIGVGAYASMCSEAVRAIQVEYVTGTMAWGLTSTFTIKFKILNPSSVAVTVTGTYEILLSAGAREASFDTGEISKYVIDGGGSKEITVSKSLWWYSDIDIAPWDRYYVYYNWFWGASMTGKVKGTLHTSTFVFSAEVPYEVSGTCKGTW